MNPRVLAQLALTALCVGGPVLARQYVARVPAAAMLFGTVLGLTPLIIPSRPRVLRPSLDQALDEEARKEGLNQEQVKQLKELLEKRIRRPALRFRVLAGGVIYLIVCGLFGVMLLVARLRGVSHPALLWWTAGFLGGLFGSIVWTAIWGGRYVARPQTR